VFLRSKNVQLKHFLRIGSFKGLCVVIANVSG